MRLLSLTLESFRSYGSLELHFPEQEHVTILLGENATGKTNVLEAIAILALLSSPRDSEEADLVQWEKKHYRIQGTCRSDDAEEKKLEVVSQIEPRRQRACFVNGVRTPSNRYVGTLPIVTFMPDDLLLFTGPPAMRRRLLDTLLRQVSPTYEQALSEYDRAIKQRNALLHAIAEGLERPMMLAVWDEKLASCGAIITNERLQLFATINMTLKSELHLLGERCREACFTYIRKGEATDESVLREELLSLLSHYRERDLLTQTTTVGPHRDDWSLLFEGRDIATSASRGEQRAAVLALLLLQASFLEMRKGEKPLLLLDDIFSELDEHHRKAVLTALSRSQVLLTAVQVDPMMREKARVVACPLDTSALS
ncbi:MAG: DNA replication and repair protein RecF [Patescibacteria group bacterium]